MKVVLWTDHIFTSLELFSDFFSELRITSFWPKSLSGHAVGLHALFRYSRELKLLPVGLEFSWPGPPLSTFQLATDITVVHDTKITLEK